MLIIDTVHSRNQLSHSRQCVEDHDGENSSINKDDGGTIVRRTIKGSERPRLRDEKGDRKKVLRKVLGLYKVYLMARNPMPSDMADDDIADDAWFDVCDLLKINIDITDENRTTVSIHTSYCYQ